ncbi:MAG: hypothetical protein A3I02_01450 [Betaproteobacteria bacterium RIFCSPLOWO2_02_FULL_67_26]|nr:MAG: hypothetical protein A3I02_01450 [Betaproteobacteria bacterium RIFCSPLOWO2_02_FULL_67_26]
MSPPPFFIVGSARSGTTSIARILGAASNVYLLVEPMPNLNIETRLMMDGRLEDPVAVLRGTVIKRVETGHGPSRIYGEKNVTLGPFLKYLHDAVKCKIVFIHRDGRDVARSMIDWHTQKFGNIYRECGELPPLARPALESAAALPVHHDTSDYSRPRPPVGSALWHDWPHLSRFEMCSYYWSTINELFLDQIEQLPRESWTAIDYTNPSPEELLRVADFCGLRGLARQEVERMLGQRINSLEDRGVSSSSATLQPAWEAWDGGLRRNFDRLAAATMRRLGYYRGSPRDWAPPSYGKWWSRHDAGLEWYEWMYQSRRRMHEDFIAWVRALERAGQGIASLADFGCGLGVGYADAFRDRRYIGLDLSARNVEWCRHNRSNPLHRYACVDFVVDGIGETADVVSSSGTIDNAYDVDAFVQSMIRASSGWIYFTCYRGWFPDLREHRYSWDEKTTCFYNDISPRRIRSVLERAGCTEVDIRPMATGRSDVRYETRVIARVPVKPAHETGSIRAAAE